MFFFDVIDICKNEAFPFFYDVFLECWIKKSYLIDYVDKYMEAYGAFVDLEKTFDRVICNGRLISLDVISGWVS